MHRLITYLLIASLSGLAAALITGLLVCPAHPAETMHAPVAVTVHQAALLHESGDAVFVDCRSADDFKAAHVPGALNIPRGRLEFKHEHVLPGPHARIIVYSDAGRRSALAAMLLVRLGYPHTEHIPAGFNGWRASGHEVETGE